MDTVFSFFNFEECVAHFKAHPPVGGTVELDFSEDEIQRVHARAAQYDCTVDAFLAAVVTCLKTEFTRRDRRAALNAKVAGTAPE